MSLRSAAVAKILATCLCLPGTALAIDGQRLITHAAALRGGVTPGDTPGFPVSITQSGSYRLATNLDIPVNRDGLLIRANNVTIDLNGWRISGRQARHGVAVLMSYGSVTVRQGVIAGFTSSGIMGLGSGLIVENVQISNVSTGIMGGNALMVIGSEVSHSGNGVVCQEACHISGSSFRVNSSTAVLMASGVVLDSTFRDNAGYAIASSSGKT